MKNVLVIGATGDVGQGICAALLDSGYRVIGAGRSLEKLDALKKRLLSHGSMAILPGSVSTEADAKLLCNAAKQMIETLDCVITSVNLKLGRMPLLQRNPEDLSTHLQGNLIPHFIAAKTFIPSITDGGTYLAIGGGMADMIVPGNGLATIAQAGQRNMLRMIAREARGGPVQIRELLLYSPITGESNRVGADPAWFTDDECGRHVVAVLSQPDLYPGPILALKSKDQVGKPEPQAQTAIKQA